MDIETGFLTITKQNNFILITIDQAIKNGRTIIILPTLLIFFLPPFITFLIAEYILAVYIFPMIYVAIVLICTFPGWLWWSFKEPKWKIWAYENIQTTDIAELKRRAIAAGLIW